MFNFGPCIYILLFLLYTVLAVFSKAWQVGIRRIKWKYSTFTCTQEWKAFQTCLLIKVRLSSICLNISWLNILFFVVTISSNFKYADCTVAQICIWFWTLVFNFHAWNMIFYCSYYAQKVNYCIFILTTGTWSSRLAGFELQYRYMHVSEKQNLSVNGKSMFGSKRHGKKHFLTFSYKNFPKIRLVMYCQWEIPVYLFSKHAFWL